jgi:hypothetical protein
MVATTVLENGTNGANGVADVAITSFEVHGMQWNSTQKKDTIF